LRTWLNLITRNMGKSQWSSVSISLSATVLACQSNVGTLSHRRIVGSQMRMDCGRGYMDRWMAVVGEVSANAFYMADAICLRRCCQNVIDMHKWIPLHALCDRNTSPHSHLSASIWRKVKPRRAKSGAKAPCHPSHPLICISAASCSRRKTSIDWI